MTSSKFSSRFSCIALWKERNTLSLVMFVLSLSRSSKTIRLCNSLSLNRMSTSTTNRPALRGIIFDMDGTLTVPNLDFAEMYDRCGVSRNDDILTAIRNMESTEAKKAKSIVEEMEEEGRRTLQLCPGALSFGRWLKFHGIGNMALVTRNSRKTLDYMVDKLWMPSDGVQPFIPALSRDDGEDIPHKPHPASLQVIAKQWGITLPCDGLLMVGDSPKHDVAYGKAAGVSTALIHASDSAGDSEPDIHVTDLAHLPFHIWKTFHIDGAYGTDNATFLKSPPPQPSSKAARAAVEGDTQTLSSLSYSELTAVDQFGNTPLIWAVDAGQLYVVEQLLQTPGLDVNTRGYLGATAISRAARHGYSDIIRLLSKQGNANPNIPNDKMQYPLHFAGFKKHPHAVQALLECGADTVVFDRKGRTPVEDTSDDGIKQTILDWRKKQFDSM